MCQLWECTSFTSDFRGLDGPGSLQLLSEIHHLPCAEDWHPGGLPDTLRSAVTPRQIIAGRRGFPGVHLWLQDNPMVLLGLLWTAWKFRSVPPKLPSFSPSTGSHWPLDWQLSQKHLPLVFALARMPVFLKKKKNPWKLIQAWCLMPKLRTEATVYQSCG